MTERVNHPKHYTSHPSGVEVIELTEGLDFCVGNGVKYILRAPHKGNEVEDLEKALWYLRRQRLRWLADGDANTPRHPRSWHMRFRLFLQHEPRGERRTAIVSLLVGGIDGGISDGVVWIEDIDRALSSVEMLLTAAKLRRSDDRAFPRDHDHG